MVNVGLFNGLFETTATSLNPTTYADGPSDPITFNYDDRYYWTVEAFNGLGSAVVEPAHSFVIESDPTIVLPHTQDFGTTLTWPSGWTQMNTGGVTDRWAVTDTDVAGGTSNEMTLTWASGTFISRLITPPINTTGVSNLAVNFKQTYDGYATGITAKVQYSNDLVTWFDSPWSIVGTSATVGPNTGTALITGLSAPVTYVAWVLDGNHFNVDYWYVDDVSIQVPPAHDVAALSYDVATEVVPENTSVTPVATVGNNGINTETFTVTCTIGTYTNTQTVTGLAMGATQQVSFAPLIPALWTGNTVTITTNLGTDTVAANNTVTGALICLDLNIPAVANNANTDAFVSFNLADPTTATVLPTAYTGSYFIAGADWMNGAWMGVEYDDGTLATDNYYNINPITGVYLPSLGEPGVAIMGNAWDDTHGIMYGVGAGNLYTMNPTTGLATLLGTMWYNNSGTPANFADINGLMIDIAYDNTNNILYGIDLGNDCLWNINTATYEVTLIGFLGIDLNYAQDAAFDQTNGMLFLAGYAGGGALYWIDTTSGAAYKVNNFPSNQEYTAFAIPYGTFAAGPVATMTGSGTVTWAAVPGAVSYNVYSSDDPYGTYTLEDNVIGTSYTNTTASHKFYQITAVGGRQVSNRQPIRMGSMMKKATNAKNFKPLFTNVAR